MILDGMKVKCVHVPPELHRCYLQAGDIGVVIVGQVMREGELIAVRFQWDIWMKPEWVVVIEDASPLL